MSQTDTQQIASMIQSRRTIKPKAFSDRMIDDSIVQELLENANWAPTHGMTEPWRFTVFVGDAKRRLADFMAQTYQSITTPETFKPNKQSGMKGNILRAPVVIAIGMKRQVSGKISELDEIQAVACAVQNMHLTAAAHGLGGFWSTNVAACSDELRDFTGLSGDDRALGLFYLGYPAGPWPTSQRGSVEEKVKWVRD